MVLHSIMERQRKETRYMLYSNCYREKQQGLRINEEKKCQMST